MRTMKPSDIPYILVRVIGMTSGLLLTGIALLGGVVPNLIVIRGTFPFQTLLALLYLALLVIPHRWSIANRTRYMAVFLGMLTVSVLLVSPVTWLAILPPLFALEVSRGRAKMKARFAEVLRRYRSEETSAEPRIAADV